MKISILYIKIKNALNYLSYLLIYQRLGKIHPAAQPKTLLLIRLDAIGDYILFRNFLEAIRKSKRFAGYRITLCGNIAWKDIAETFDKDFIDEFIWVSRNSFYKSYAYKFNILKRIRESGYETAIDMAYSREILYGDSIIRGSNAKIRIGSEGAKDSHVVWKRKLFSNENYTDIIKVDDNDSFEFYRNKEFVEKILGEKTNVNKLYIDVLKVQPGIKVKQPYAVLFFGASTKEKIWDINNYIETAQFLIEEYNLNIVLTGGIKETKDSHIFIDKLGTGRITDTCGKTTLPELAEIISKSQILISNDSAAVHLAAGVGKVFICISNGERIIRFHPYPKEVFDKAYYLYPDKIMSNLNNPDILSHYRYGSDLDINSIKTQVVKDQLKRIL